MLLYISPPLAGDFFEGLGGNAEAVAIYQISSQVTHATQDPGADKPE
jgi:hypothetical protein